jgi:GNAT superfamily N-acetyltransferase
MVSRKFKNQYGMTLIRKRENIISNTEICKINNGADDIISATINFENRILNKYPLQLFRLSSSATSRIITICIIEIKDEYKNQGFGTRIMEEICNFCDEHKLKSYIKPDPNFGTDIKVLEKFYSKFGFSKIKGSKSNIMVRKPVELVWVV